MLIINEILQFKCRLICTNSWVSCGFANNIFFHKLMKDSASLDLTWINLISFLV